MTKEAKRFHAKNLRYKKPIANGLTVDDIWNKVSEISEECDSAIYIFETDEETIVAALCGDDDDGQEFKMQFGDLGAECDKMLEELNDYYGYSEDSKWKDYFDTFFAATADESGELLGWDSFEGDFYGLDRYETELAKKVAADKLEALTKKDLIRLVTRCISVFVNYNSLLSRYESLKAALDVVRENNTYVLSNAKRLSELYDRYQDADCFDKKQISDEIERVIKLLPSETMLY